MNHRPSITNSLTRARFDLRGSERKGKKIERETCFPSFGWRAKMKERKLE